jgi:hypothetical protein
LAARLPSPCSSPAALAQLPKDDQKCIDQYNNKLRLVSQTAGKSARKCIKNATKGKESNPDTCVVTNTDGKIAGKESKVIDLYTSGKCTGAEVIQQGAATGSTAHNGAITDFMHDVFGDPIPQPDVISTDKLDAKCLDKAVQRSTQYFTEIVKNHRKCKKDAMNNGTVIDETSLTATCGSLFDIDTKGKVQKKQDKLNSDVGASCAGTTSALTVLFPGLAANPTCTVSANAVATCLSNAARCRVCKALNTADGMNIDCDLFDDGANNSSCGAAFNVGTHICTLGAGSAINLGTQALPLSLNPTGTVQISCGNTDGAGKAACGCDVQSFGVLVIPSIGDVCINPAACPSGEIDCNGGNAQDVDLVADHNIGACTDDTTCGASCTAYCGGLGAAYARLSYGCEGFCQGGANNNNACTLDSQCPGGACTGAEPVVHTGVCNCTCQAEGLGSPAAAGALSCEVGTQINVELPSNGLCDQAVPTISLAPVCGAVTTTSAKGLVQNANNTAAKTIPPIGGVGTAPDIKTGAAISCGTIQSSTLTGLKLVGHLGFFDSTLGDIFSTNTFICQ